MKNKIKNKTNFFIKEFEEKNKNSICFEFLGFLFFTSDVTKEKIFLKKLRLSLNTTDEGIKKVIDTFGYPEQWNIYTAEFKKTQQKEKPECANCKYFVLCENSKIKITNFFDYDTFYFSRPKIIEEKTIILIKEKINCKIQINKIKQEKKAAQAKINTLEKKIEDQHLVIERLNNKTLYL